MFRLAHSACTHRDGIVEGHTQSLITTPGTDLKNVDALKSA